MRGAPRASSYDGRRSSPRDPSPSHAALTTVTARLLAAAATALAAGAIAGCGGSAARSSTVTPSTSVATSTATTTTTPATPPGTGKPPITIGDENYTEQFVLGQLYLLALKAQGFTVTIDPNLGPVTLRLQQLQDGGSGGGVDMYPEYLNVWNSQIANDNRHFTSTARAYAAAQGFASDHGLELLSPTPFSDTAGIGVTVTFAQQNGLRSIFSLAKLAPSLTMGGPPGPQFQDDTANGLPAMEAAYGFSPATYKPLEIGKPSYSALDQGTVQAAYVNTTDGEFTTGDYRLLTDPKVVFGIGNVVPVVTLKALEDEGPAFAQTIDKVSALLTLPVMRELNSLVDLSGETAAGVASRFLADHGLIPASTVITS